MQCIDSSEGCKCTREKGKFTNGSKESLLKYNIRGNGETDFCLGFVAQWFIHWYFSHRSWVQSWMEVSFYLVRSVFHEHLTVYTKGTYVCHNYIYPTLRYRSTLRKRVCGLSRCLSMDDFDILVETY